MVALAVNPRTAAKAAIRRASASARRAMVGLDRDMRSELERVYLGVRDDLVRSIEGYAGRDGTLRLEVLQDLLGQVDARLQALNAARDGLLGDGLRKAAELGVDPWRGASASIAGDVTRVADEAVRFTLSFVAEDGLQLSDRIWRLNAGARDAVRRQIEQAVIQGHSASRATLDFLGRGEPVPPELAAKVGASQAGRVAKAAGAALITGPSSPYAHALTVFRTEINRAHGEAYMRSGEGHEDFGGWRFMLSPRHPEPDICDMHARANVHGLGPGVYPSRERCPWPAHPNTLSFVQIVFVDEISEEDRAGKLSRIDWLRGQPPGVQAAVLRSRHKAGALRAGILRENEIATPWRVLRRRYERRGIDIDQLRPPPPRGKTIEGSTVLGMDPGLPPDALL